MEKKIIRQQIRELKKKCSFEEKERKSRLIWEKIEQQELFRHAKVVLAYWSMEDEVSTHDFVCRWAGQKTILLPCVRGEELELRYFESREQLSPGEGFGIPEPVGALFTQLQQIDLVLVPGVAFDATGNRLGRGKGYYDKILKQTSACKIGVCFDFQLLEQIPVEEHDVKMDQVICDL